MVIWPSDADSLLRHASRTKPGDLLSRRPATPGASADRRRIQALRDHGLQAPISVKAIKGRINQGMLEIRTGGYRTLFCQRGGVVWILHVCKKQDQDAGIAAASKRMRLL